MSVDESIVILAPMFQVGCFERVLDRDAARARRGCGPRNGPPLAVRTIRATSSRRAAAQALVDRRVLGVDRHDLAAARARAPRPRPGPPAMRLSLLASARRLPGFERGERRRQAREADDRVEHDVGVGERGELGEHVRVVERRERARSAGTPNSAACAREQLGVAAGGERDDLGSRRGGGG